MISFFSKNVDADVGAGTFPVPDQVGGETWVLSVPSGVADPAVGSAAGCVGHVPVDAPVSSVSLGRDR